MKSRNKIFTEMEMLHVSTYFYIIYYNIKLIYSKYIIIFSNLIKKN